jgi:hypothetical protein
MKKKLQIAVLLLISITAKAQQNYFVYLQTDNKQPFYVKVSGKVLSSSTSGYLVIPKLNTGEYPIVVGFAKDQWPQQNFSLDIANADAGYLLKNFGEKGWGLYNLQSMQITMNGENTAAKPKSTDDDDAFAKSLSSATNATITPVKEPVVEEPIAKVEPVVKKTPEKKLEVKEVVLEEPVKPEPIVKKASVKKEPAEVVDEVITKEEPVKTTAVIDAPVKIEKLRSNLEDDVRSITYKVTTGDKVETVDVSITYPPKKKEIVAQKEIAKTEPKTDKKFLDIDMQNPSTKPSETKESPVFVQTDKPVVPFNSDCKATATEDDFFKTRKRMAMQENDDDMVDAALKAFKIKCYSVEQVKNLSVLFLKDTGRYKFFDAVYPFVTDSQNFASLQKLLSDTYYINRFKSMLRN